MRCERLRNGVVAFRGNAFFARWVPFALCFAFVIDGSVVAQSGRKPGPPTAEQSPPPVAQNPLASFGMEAPVTVPSAPPVQATKVRMAIEIPADSRENHAERIREAASQLAKRLRAYPGVEVVDELFFASTPPESRSLPEFRLVLSGLKGLDEEYNWGNSNNRQNRNQHRYYVYDHADRLRYALRDRTTNKRILNNSISVRESSVDPYRSVIETVALGVPQDGLTRLQQAGNALADRIMRDLKKRGMYFSGTVAAQFDGKTAPSPAPTTTNEPPSTQPTAPPVTATPNAASQASAPVQMRVRMIVEIASDANPSQEGRLRESAIQLIKRLEAYPGVEAGDEVSFMTDDLQTPPMRTFRLSLCSLQNEKYRIGYWNDAACRLRYALHDAVTNKRVLNAWISTQDLVPSLHDALYETVILGPSPIGLSGDRQSGHALADQVMKELRKRGMY